MYLSEYYQFSHLLHIRSQKTALTCVYFFYTSLCMNSTRYLFSIVSLFSFPSPTPPPPLFNKLGLLAWVGPLSHLIISLPTSTGSGCFILWVRLLPPQIIHWVSANAQGFLSPFIISGCVRQPPKFVHWGLCPLTAPLSGCALGFVSTNRPIYFAGCVR